LIDRIKSPWLTVSFDHGAQSEQLMHSLPHSRAASIDGGNFRYVGSGYFYSPMEYSSGHWAAKLFGEFIEGSLLDFQLADVFSQCTAGDVRVHFEAVVTPTLSMLAMQHADQLVPFRTSTGFEVALASAGQHSATSMMEAELWSQHLTIIGLRAVLMLMMLLLIRATVMESQTWALTLLFTASVCGGLLAFDKLLVWGYSHLATLTLLAAVVGSVVTLRARKPLPQEPHVKSS
jgi:hypothetical protein